MGRGRQKAKHTKVARDLKYFSPDTNYGALARELNGSDSTPSVPEDNSQWPEYSGHSSGGHNAAGDDSDDDRADDYGTADDSAADDSDDDSRFGSGTASR